MVRAGTTLLLLAVSGCVTAGRSAAVSSSVLLEPPDEACEPLGPMAIRMSSELLMSEDALQATAVNELRWRAAVRGATHLVVDRPLSSASLAYGTTAAASGVAYRCPDWR
jgi:hypothetical protein